MSTLIEALLPAPGVAVLDARSVTATAPQIFAALSRLRAEALGSRILRAGLRLAGIDDREGLLYAQLLAGGFVVLAADPLREVVIGRIFAAGPAPRLRDRGDFIACATPGCAKLALAVRVQDGSVAVELRARVVGLGRAAAAARPLARRGVAAFLDALERELRSRDRSR